MQRHEIRRDDVVLSYLDSGTDGPVVVLLHGLAGSAEELAPTATALTDRFRVLVLDQRGHGHSTRRPADTSREAFADDVVALVEQVAGGGQVAAVVGQSMGAHTALLLAAWHPQLVSALVLLEGGVGGDDVDVPAQLGDWFASWPAPFPTRAAAVEHLGGTPTARAWAADLDERDGGFWPRFDADVLRAVMEPVAATARWAEWEQVEAPTLLVRGEHGTIADDEVARMLALRPATAHVVVPGAGHDVHLDAPEETARLVLGFLTRA